MSPSPHVLGLFAKWPTPGAVKTRLTVDPNRAAAVARAVLLDAILAHIPWSTSRVLHKTVERLTFLDSSLAVLPPWYDVDTPDDWALLRGHVAVMRRAGLDPGVPHTEALLREDVP